MHAQRSQAESSGMQDERTRAKEMSRRGFEADAPEMDGVGGLLLSGDLRLVTMGDEGTGLTS